MTSLSKANPKADIDYPGDQLTKFLQAASGDAEASLPDGLKLGESATGRVMQPQDGSETRLTGYWTIPNTAAGLQQALIRYRHDGNPVPTSDMLNWTGQVIKTGATSNVVNKSDLFKSDPGFAMTAVDDAFYGRGHRFMITVDRRGATIDRVVFETWYQTQDNGAAYMWYTFVAYKAKSPNDFYFSQWNAAPATWEVYKG